MNRPSDSAQREAAVRNLHDNLCVTAGAGAGKTSLLVERVLHAVLAGEIPLSRIVAITFTEKAAAELRERVQRSLEDVARRAAEREPGDDSEASRALGRLNQDGLPGGVIRRRARRALEEEGVVTTIHGFAVQILRRWPEQAGLAPDFEVDEGTHWRHFLRTEWPRCLRRHLARLDERGRQVLARLRVEDLRAIVAALAVFPERARDRSLDFSCLRSGIQDLHDTIAQDRETVVAGRSRSILSQLDSHRDALALLLECGPDRLRERLEQRLLHDTLDKSPLGPSPTVEGVDREVCKQRLKSSHTLLKSMAQVDEDWIGDLLALTEPMAEELVEASVRTGRVTFDELLLRCRRLLLDHPETRRREGARIDRLLVDEFQDTDPLQCDLAFLLCEQTAGAAGDAGLFASGSGPATDAWSVTLTPGKLFLVGDPKQSIYRFRGADLEIYHRAVDQVLAQGGQELTLTHCFRSPPTLVDPLNVLFGATLGPRSRSEPDFHAMQSGRRPRDDDPAIEIWSVDLGDEKVRVSEGRRAEGQHIARQIRQWVDGGLRCGDVAILLRGLTSLTMYLRPLREAELPCVVDGGRTFVERTEVNEFLCLLRAVACADDPVSFVGALRSSLYGIDDVTLASYAGAGLPWSTDAAVTADAFPQIQTAARHLETLRRRLHEQPAAAVIDALLEESPLLPIAATAFEGAERIANLRKLAQLAQDRVAALGVPLAEALDEVTQTLEGVEGESESSLADEDIDAIRILTIHKAKGLEFPVVVLPDLQQFEHDAADPAARVRTLNHTSGIYAAVEAPPEPVHNLAMTEWLERDREHRHAENKRLLYVAMTRAKERLVLVNHRLRGLARSPWLSPLAHWGYAPDGEFPVDDQALLEGAVRHRLLRPQPQATGQPAALPPIGQLHEAVRRFEGVREELRSAPPPFRRPSDEDQGERFFEAESGAAPGPGATLARVVGIACHRVLQRLGPAGPFPEDAVEGLVRGTARGEAADEDAVWEEARAILLAPALQELLRSFGDVEVLARELPLLLPVEGQADRAPEPGSTSRQVVRGTADLVYRDSTGIVVCDYKTDRARDLDALAARHGPQLKLYAIAVREALGLERRPAIELLLLPAAERMRLEDDGRAASV